MRHEQKGLGAVIGDGGTGLTSNGLPVAQEVIACGEVLLPAEVTRRLVATLPRLAGHVELRAVAAVRGHARESVTLGDAHWREIRSRIEALDDERGLRAVVVVNGVATRDLGSDALAGAAAALTALADQAPGEAVIADLRVLATDVEGRERRLHTDGLPDAFAGRLPPKKQALAGTRCAVITLSDRASQGVYEDKSGAKLAQIITAHGGAVVHASILPDNSERLALEIEVLSRRGDIELLVCTGGTGIGPRDITPETLISLGIRPIPGIGELLRTQSAQIVRSAWLSRSVAGVLGQMVLIALPGSQKAVEECMQVLLPLLPHTLSMLRGGDHG